MGTPGGAADERRQRLLTLAARAKSGDGAWGLLLERAMGPEAALTHTFGRALRHLSAFEKDVLRADLHPGRPSASAVAAGLTEAYERLVTAEAVREFRSSARRQASGAADTVRLVEHRDRCDALGELLADWEKHRHTPVPDEVVAQVTAHGEGCPSCREWLRATPLTAEEKRVLLERIADHFALPSESTLPRWLAGPRPRRGWRLFRRTARQVAEEPQEADSVKPG